MTAIECRPEHDEDRLIHAEACQCTNHACSLITKPGHIQTY